MTKTIRQLISPYNGPSVSRMAEDTGRVAIQARLTGMSGAERKIGEPGHISMYLEVNQWGLVALDVQESASASGKRDLFYAQLAIDRSERSGVRVVRETVPPARPAGALNLTATQIEALRSNLAIMEDRAGLGSRRSDQADRQRAEFRESAAAVRAILFPPDPTA